MQIGGDSFGAVISDPATGFVVSPVRRMQNLMGEIVLADQVGLDVFGVGEHHRSEFVDSAPGVILRKGHKKDTAQPSRQSESR